ncbi:uncharacterized protein LOC111301864 [Durio zibethinus]|uniref:Uncharacterized protein LOC111301864 n=1 Tax=Durio zibethinus TaxID=66656 RepID=A0A6P5ZL62_DURZI|nr:uncharacterized protein LOC111301864 [Durio zibethinus]
MSPFATFLLLVSSLALLSIARGQDRAPHGIAYKNPMAISPSAYEFFHSKTEEPDTKSHCAASNCSPLPVAAQADATKALETQVSTQQNSGYRLGAGGIAVIVLGLAFAVLLSLSEIMLSIAIIQGNGRHKTVGAESQERSLRYAHNHWML